MQNTVSSCNFMLAPMSDRYIDLIIGSVTKVDTSRIEANTGKMGTVYRGSRADVLDAVRACFSYAFAPEVHMTLTMTFAEGCPGNCGNAETAEEAAGDGSRANEAALKDIHFPVDCKFAYYPLGREDYIEEIEKVIELAKNRGVYRTSMPQATVLKGDVAELFAYFNEAIALSEETGGHFIYEITFSVNSPSAD